MFVAPLLAAAQDPFLRRALTGARTLRFAALLGQAPSRAKRFRGCGRMGSPLPWAPCELLRISASSFVPHRRNC